jgi:hypothetical protein
MNRLSGLDQQLEADPTPGWVYFSFAYEAIGCGLFKRAS